MGDSLQVLMFLCHPREYVGYNLPRIKVERLKGFKHEKVSPNINDDVGIELFSKCPGTLKPSTEEYPQQHPTGHQHGGQRRLGEVYL